MNLKRTLFSGLVSFGIIASVAAPAAFAAPTESNTANNTTDATVTVVSGGTFDAFFTSGVNLTLSPAPTSVDAGTAIGSLTIGYTDTLTYRPNFNTQVSSSNFVRTDADEIYETPISAANFKITQVHNVGQLQWSSGSGLPIGDLGQFVNEAYVGQGAPWPKPWTTNNTLEQARSLQFGYNGIGTTVSLGQFDVELTIPIGTVPGTYQSVVTLTIIPGTQSK